MLLYAVSSGAGGDVLGWVEAMARAGVDYVQIREKQLASAALFELCCHARRSTAGSATRLLLNRRFDIALAAGLHGVHLPADGLPVAAVRRAAPPGFLIACSCHSPAELAAAAGADFCVFGPVFPTPSKLSYGPPLGLEALRQACRASPVPVVALGGIAESQVPSCLQAGAAGIAAIRLFQPGPAVVGRLRHLGTEAGETA